MRRATWSGLEGRAVLPRDRKPRETATGDAPPDVKDEGTIDSLPPSAAAIETSSD